MSEMSAQLRSDPRASDPSIRPNSSPITSPTSPRFADARTARRDRVCTPGHLHGERGSRPLRSAGAAARPLLQPSLLPRVLGRGIPTRLGSAGRYERPRATFHDHARSSPDSTRASRDIWQDVRGHLGHLQHSAIEPPCINGLSRGRFSSVHQSISGGGRWVVGGLIASLPRLGMMKERADGP
jgi:hypothetical protein